MCYRTNFVGAWILAIHLSSVWSCIVIAPNSFKVGNVETVLIYNKQNRNVRGSVQLLDHPLNITHYDEQSFHISAGNFHLSKYFVKQSSAPSVCLRVTCEGGFVKTAEVPLIHSTGYIFLQTDKPIYNPKQKKANIRFVATDENLTPVNRTYKLQILNPSQRLSMVKEFRSENSSMFSFEYEFPDDPAIGEWTVAVHYGEGFKQKETTTFTMKEYVLPTFKVDVHADEVLLPYMETATFRVEAKYVYGKPVEGQVFLKYFTKGETEHLEQRGISGTVSLDENGVALFNLSLSTYKVSNSWGSTIKYHRLVVEAVVTEKSTLKKETGSTSKSIFALSRYKLSVGMVQPEIRPGFPALIVGRVTYANGAVAADVAVEIYAYTDEERRINVRDKVQRTNSEGMVHFFVDTSPKMIQMRFKLRAGDIHSNKAGEYIEDGRVLKAYPDRDFIALKKFPPTTRMRVGSSIDIEVQSSNPAAFEGVLVLIMSAGKIVAFKKLDLKRHSKVSFELKDEMAPIARVLAVAWKQRGEMIADSFYFNLARSCRHAEFEITPSILGYPGSSGELEITGAEEGTTVGLLIVDEAVYALQNATILSQNTIFSKIQSHDRGCGDGGGSSLQETLIAVGAFVMSDASAPHAYAPSCNDIERKVRMRRSAQLEQRRGDRIAELCCKLAHSRYLQDSTCEERKKALILKLRGNHEADKDRCRQEFLKCCDDDRRPVTPHHLMQTNHNEGISFRGRRPDLYFAPNIELTEEPVPEVNVRRDFRESFLFQEFTINKKGEPLSINVDLPHSITTWSIQAMSVNPRGGICAKDPIRVESFQPVFLQLDMPYQVVRNEHVEIKVTLFNYGDVDIRTRISMHGVEGVCTSARPGERSEPVTEMLGKFSSKTVGFPIFPLKEGDFKIRVDAITDAGSDSVEKILHVIHEGRLERQSYSVSLDPTNIQRRTPRSVSCGKSCQTQVDPRRRNQTITIETLLPHNVVEGSQKVTVGIIGEKMGPAMQTAMLDMDHMLDLPRGCGEQNMMRMAPLVYTSEYRKLTRRLDKATEEKAKHYVMLAYGRQLNFRKADGSFGAFKNRKSSIWLTAFVAKVFCRASKIVDDPDALPKVAKEALEWLTIQQESDGSFKESKPIMHKSLLGGVKGKLALTAFIALAYDDCQQYLSAPSVQARTKARAYLMSNMDTSDAGYTAALVAFALSGTNSSSHAFNLTRNLMVIDTELNTLSVATHDSPQVIEGNGYALLAATTLGRQDLMVPLYNWLISKQTATGGYSSTQDTIVALQALSTYASSATKEPLINLTCHVTDGQNFDRTLRVARDTAVVLQQLTTNNVTDKMLVHTTGVGSGILSIDLKYNVIIPAEEMCPFNVTLTSVLYDDASSIISDGGNGERDNMISSLEELYDSNSRKRRSLETSPRDARFNLTVCATLLAEEASGMGILEVGMVTGYEPFEEDLQYLQDKKFVDKVENNGRVLNFYMPQFEPKTKTCVSFRVKRAFLVANAQEAPVTAYNYYDSKAGRCPIFYSLRQGTEPVLVDCRSNRDKMCKCLQNSCPPKNPFIDLTGTGTSDENLAEARRMVCRYDYVILAKVVASKKVQRSEVTTFKVDHDLREKSPGMAGRLINITTKTHCGILLQENAEYLIFGHEGEKRQLPDGSMERTYLLGEHTRHYKNSSDNSYMDQIKFSLFVKLLSSQGKGEKLC